MSTTSLTLPPAPPATALPATALPAKPLPGHCAARSATALPATPEPRRPALRARGGAELLVQQVAALDAWVATLRHRSELAASRSGAQPVTRETRLDQSRLATVLRHEHAALLARCAADEATVLPLAHRLPVRVVVVHRHDWLRGRLVAELRTRGVRVEADLTSGADAVAAVVLEQPDLLLVEDLLPLVSGVDVVRQARRLAPDLVIGVQVGSERARPEAVAAGADLVFHRRTPPAEMASALVDELARRRLDEG